MFPAESLVLPRSRQSRRQPQLSCNTCRQRKRKCDRQKPCSHCTKHHLESTCLYADAAVPHSSRTQVRMTSTTPQYLQDESVSVSSLGDLATPSSSASISSPKTAELRLTESGTGFKESTHWSSVLSDVTGTKNQDDALGAIKPGSTLDDGSSHQKVLLFEGCNHVTDQQLFQSIPPRSESDCLVALYFRAQEHRSVIHPTEFLRRYNAFWKNPITASISWLGLLYSIFCLSSQGQNQDDGASRVWSPTALYKIMKYREKVVQCLVRSQFAKGGPEIIETLVHYVLIESYMNRDSNIEVWLLMGNIIQIAVRMGYHRDPHHFKSLSPFQGEMRRRMWAMIYSLDIGFATQMGLPSSIKHSLSDTKPPRNLQDRDFDASSPYLPPARFIDELTSSTVILAKLHVASRLGLIIDKICSPDSLSYDELVAVNSTLDTTFASIPSPCKFRPMSESILDPPSVIFQQINFYMHYQRTRILVNWKFLRTSKEIAHTKHCLGIVTEAALEIMRLQHRMAEESEVLGCGMVDSCFIKNGYFLAVSIACFIVQYHNDILAGGLLELRSLLEKSLGIWSRTNNLSREENKVVAALKSVLSAQTPSTDNQVKEMEWSEVGEGTLGKGQMPFSSYDFCFDDLPFMIADNDSATFQGQEFSTFLSSDQKSAFGI